MRGNSCPDCSSPHTISGQWHSTIPGGSEFQIKEPSVGDRCPYVCLDCDTKFIAVIPEPRNAYFGDGHFALNH